METMTVTERNWSALAHGSGGALMFFVPSFGFIAPLVIYLTKGESSPAIRFHARQALFFQVGMSIVAWVCGMLGSALACFVIGMVLYIPMFIAWFAGVLFPILAAIKVNNGHDGHAYPLIDKLVDKPPQLG